MAVVKEEERWMVDEKDGIGKKIPFMFIRIWGREWYMEKSVLKQFRADANRAIKEIDAIMESD